MSRTLDLRKVLQKELKTIAKNVFYEEAISNISYPYIVYKLESTKNEVGYHYSLEIDVWDKSKSTKQVEMISDDVEYLLDDTYFSEATFTVTIDLNTRNTIEDTDKSLKRRRLLFDLAYFDERG